MIKVGDRVIRKKDLVSMYLTGGTKGIVLMEDNNDSCYINWGALHGGTWTPKSYVELDIQGERDNKLKELGI